MRRMVRLLYWCFTIVGLTGVFVVLRGRPKSLAQGGGHYRHSHFLSQGDFQDKHHLRNKPAQFVVPVENPGVVQNWGNGAKAKLEIGGGEVEFEQNVKPIQLPMQRNLHYAEPEISKPNMRKLDEIRNISKSEPKDTVLSKTVEKIFNVTTKKTPQTYQELNSDHGAGSSVKNDTLENTTIDDIPKKNQTLKLEDVFIGVKTTTHYHKSRLHIVVKTWFPQAKDQTYFFTDGDDPELQNITGGHMVNTECPTDHRRQSLCCKLAVMYQKYMESGKKWFCHLDDDNYLNVPNLLSLLSGYASDKDFYLGRRSLDHPLEATDRDDNMKHIQFWFATGGAGFCISRALALNMFPYAGGGVFKTMCNRVRLPDDVTVGFISEYLVGTKLINIKLFNSHLQSLKMLTGQELKEQVTLSYGCPDQRINVVSVPDAIFTSERDPSRLLSLHCYLYPEAELCKSGLS